MTSSVAELESLMVDRLGPVGDGLDAVGSLDVVHSSDGLR
jgi:hypothetical protein